MQSQPPPKGSLEELFRHHLLESEAAAVPPRPLVWEHIDNGLLQAQNEKYRRRLFAYRWGMAASLLLATLAGGGWWHSQQQATATLASANAQHEAARHAVAGAVPTGPRSYASPSEATAPAIAPEAAQGSAASSEVQAGAGRTLAASTATTSRTRHQAAAEATTMGLAGRGKGQLAAGSLAYATRASEQLGYGAGRAAIGAAPAHSSTVYPSHSYSIAATTTPSLAASASSLASTAPPNASAEAPLPGTASSDNTLAANAATSRLGEDALATRLASLAMPPATGLPTELAMQALPAPTPALLRRWRYGAAYTIGAFQPNIDFNRSTTAYNTSLGSNTISLTRAAAAEYRANLRPGLSQRLGLRATRWLGGRWSLSTGVEVAQQEAYSATSSAFTGEQLGDLNNFAAIPSTSPASSAPIYSRSLQESSFRYRSAGVPIELQYDNQAKPGLSFYGRLGAIVSALLSAHSEVAGNSEATRTYSLTSASTPYRRLTALLRGSAGVRYRPAGRTWGLNVGPTAEAGVQSMNAETDRNFWQQSRPYSVGIEAGIEFGGFKPVQ